ncbi:hypothetical protein ACFL6I_09125 [candidate division KSB1 bacterium]
MPELGTGINALRSLVFVRNFGNQVVEKTDIKVRSRFGNIEFTAIDSTVDPRELSFRAQNQSIQVQENKSIHDRFIDLLA